MNGRCGSIARVLLFVGLLSTCCCDIGGWQGFHVLWQQSRPSSPIKQGVAVHRVTPTYNAYASNPVAWAGVQGLAFSSSLKPLRKSPRLAREPPITTPPSPSLLPLTSTSWVRWAGAMGISLAAILSTRRAVRGVRRPPEQRFCGAHHRPITPSTTLFHTRRLHSSVAGASLCHGLYSQSWSTATLGELNEPLDITDVALQAFRPKGESRNRINISVARIHRLELESFIRSILEYTLVLLVTSAIGHAAFPFFQRLLRMVDPALVRLDLAEIGQPLGIVITTFSITFGNLLSTALGFGFSRLQAIRQSYYEEAALIGQLSNDLLILFHDLPNEREAAIRRLLRHGKAIYYTTEKARRDPRHNLDYVYIPGATTPFDDPLVRLIRQISTYAGNLRSRDAFLERILDRIDSSCRALSARRDERISWELSKPPTAMYFSLVSLNALFFLAYVLLTSRLTWEGYQLFFSAMTGACSLLYLVMIDLNNVHDGAFTIHSGLRGEPGTAPILKPTIDCITEFLYESRRECRKKGIPMKKDREF